MECCLWTGCIMEDSQLEECLFPRIYAFAEIAWYGNSDYGEFKERVAAYIFQ
ncbi:MAG: family 20 glycosylhydrolase [Lachnospiraceae bacterium]|nr:family 20 glycosylhydrolase [Lachnospiraceae bacterium]